jgi:menaquinone-specific isochorismate synthase
MKIFWRSKDGTSPPSHAEWFLQPFHGSGSKHTPTLIDQLPAKGEPIKVLQRVDRPNRSEWQVAVTRALDLPKVVLARQTILTLEKEPDPFQVAAALQEKSQGATLFCIQFSERSALLGASPERLFMRRGREIVVDAMAGTKRKGMDQDLFQSDKNRREFQFVQDYLFETLRPLSESLQFSDLSTHQTANLCHLYSQGKGKLIPGVSDLALIQALYPTPALCGFPKEKAMEWIRKHELFDRNLYGGVIGWSTPEVADWIVPIRCCFICGNIACIYTGTGIVAGSSPSEEWDELDAKLSLYEDIFPCI